MQFEFKLLTQSDLDLLYNWLNRPHIAEWWDEPLSLSEVREQYLPRPGADSSVRPYIAHLDGTPIGFIQSYVAIAEQASGWWTNETDPGVVGIDQFLADAEDLGKGLGTIMVAQFVELLFRDPGVSKIQTDPAPANMRAIRCYKRPGFAK